MILPSHRLQRLRANGVNAWEGSWVQFPTRPILFAYVESLQILLFLLSEVLVVILNEKGEG